MSGDVSNPRVWEGADAYVAPLGTTPPTDVGTEWGAAWLPLGLLSQDGMTESREQNVVDHYAWGKYVRTTKNQHKRSITVTCLEDGLAVFGLVNPGSETKTDENGLTTRTIKTPPGKDVRAFGLETRDGNITTRRIIPRGEVVGVGEVVYSEAAMTAYELTITIYADEEDILYYDLTDDPQADEGGS